MAGNTIMKSGQEVLQIIVDQLEHSLVKLLESIHPSAGGQREGQRMFQSTQVLMRWSALAEFGIVQLTDVWSQIRSDAPKAFWRSPADGRKVFVAGVLASAASSSNHPLQAVREQMEDFEARHLPALDTGDLREAIPWYGGMAFQPGGRDDIWADWPAAWFFVPKFEFTECEHGIRIKVNLIVSDSFSGVVAETLQQFRELFRGERVVEGIEPPVDSIPMDHYVSAVRDTVRDIQAGSFKKLVLAERQLTTSHKPYEIGAVLEELLENYPTAFVFAITRGNSCFIGASPERLVAAFDEEVSIDTLAGTTGRGQTTEEDNELGRALLSSSKNRHEHEVVLQGILTAIRDSATDVDYSDTPTLKKLANVQHLHTPVRARLKSGAHLFDLVDALHPTPAVAGVPKDTVLPLIREREGMDRGWYAGVVGQISSAGNGEFCVALRSGLVLGNMAWLYAGAGIMGDSDPALEWEETLLKLRPMKSALERATARDCEGQGSKDS